MNVEMMIGTYYRDFPWLKYCLRSIDKFCAGFAAITVQVPDRDYAAAVELVAAHCGSKARVVDGGEEWPGRGMLWHMNAAVHFDQICRPDTDFIAHVDADCVFAEPVTPDRYFVNGRPLLRYEPYASLSIGHPEIQNWQTFTQGCLPFPVVNETMRCYPFVYHRGLYRVTRELIEQAVQQPVPTYLKSLQNTFPWGFTEFNTLGSVAMHQFSDQYQFLNPAVELNVSTGIQHYWSHGGITPEAVQKMRALGLECAHQDSW